jgi:hypothetical protein
MLQFLCGTAQKALDFLVHESRIWVVAMHKRSWQEQVSSASSRQVLHTVIHLDTPA